MVIDVLLAVAIRAVALGAVTELHVGVIGVGLAADGAFVEIALLLIDRFGSLFEVDGLGGMPVLVALLAVIEGICKLDPEEDEKVKDGHQREKSPQPEACPETLDDVPDKESGIDPGQPLYLHRQDHHEQDLHIGEKNSKREQHGQIHIMDRGDAENQPVDDIQKHTKKIEAVEPGGSPLPFQCAADPIIEISGYSDHEQRCAGDSEIKESKISGDRDKNKGNEPPYLSSENRGLEKEQQSRERIGAEVINEADSRLTNGDIEHQVGDPKVGMLNAELVNFILDPTQDKNLLGKAC